MKKKEILMIAVIAALSLAALLYMKLVPKRGSGQLPDDPYASEEMPAEEAKGDWIAVVHRNRVILWFDSGIDADYTVEGVHFPYSYLINWPEDGHLDASKDYYMDAWHSFFWVNAFSSNLTKMQEPILYNNKLPEDEVVFRFSFFPSFHPPASFRVVKNKSTAMLYWKILITKYDPKTWKEVSSTVSEGHRKMTAAQYEKLLQYMEAVRLDELPRSVYVMMTDGAQWVIERVTDQGFKAHFTNVAGKSIQQVYSFLVKLSGEKLEYVKEY